MLFPASLAGPGAAAALGGGKFLEDGVSLESVDFLVSGPGVFRLGVGAVRQRREGTKARERPDGATGGDCSALSVGSGAPNGSKQSTVAS